GPRRHSLSLESTEQPGKYVLFGGVAYAEVTREVLVLAPDPIWEWSRRAAVHAERVMSGGTYDSGAADPATPLVFGCSNPLTRVRRPPACGPARPRRRRSGRPRRPRSPGTARAGSPRCRRRWRG